MKTTRGKLYPTIASLIPYFKEEKLRNIKKEVKEIRIEEKRKKLKIGKH
jgi:hypothetical protein